MKIFAAALTIVSLFPQAANAAGIRTKKNRKLVPCPAADEAEQQDPTPTAVYKKEEENPFHNVEFEYSFDLLLDHDVTFSPDEQGYIFEAFQRSFNDLNDPEYVHMDVWPILTDEIHEIIYKHPHHDGRKLRKRLHEFEEDDEGHTTLKEKITITTIQRTFSEIWGHFRRDEKKETWKDNWGFMVPNTQLSLNVRPTIPDNQIRGRGDGDDGDGTGGRALLLSDEHNESLAEFLMHWERLFCSYLNGGENVFAKSTENKLKDASKCKINVLADYE